MMVFFKVKMETEGTDRLNTNTLRKKRRQMKRQMNKQEIKQELQQPS